MQFGRLYLASSITLATRVRVDILKAIVKQFLIKGKKEMYMVAYCSRPVMLTKSKGQKGPSPSPSQMLRQIIDKKLIQKI